MSMYPRTYRNIEFSAKAFKGEDGKTVIGYRLYARRKGSGGNGKQIGLLYTPTRTGTWIFEGRNAEFTADANGNIKDWLHCGGHGGGVREVLFAIKYTYITYFFHDEVYVIGDEMEIVDESFLHGTQRDVEQALGIF